MRPGADLDAARAAKARAAALFERLVGEAVAVGITRLAGRGYGLKVNLTHAPPASSALPDEVDGVPVQVEVVGRLRKRREVE